MESLTELSRANNLARTMLTRSLLVFIVVLFFCDIAIYLSLVVSSRLEPQYWIALLVAFAVALGCYSPRTRWKVFRTPVFFWCAGFLLLSLIVYVGVPASHVEQLKELIRTVVLLTAFLAVFLMVPDQIIFLRKLILFAVMLGVVINIISIFHNGFIPLADSSWEHRPTGFYPNPNENGVALVLGMILSVCMISKNWRVLFCLVVLMGVGATFSREAIAGWMVAMVFLCASRIISWRVAMAYLVICAICVFMAGLIIVKSHLIPSYTLVLYHDEIRRFYAVFRGISSDSSGAERWQVLKLGWTTFLAHPFIGNGIGSTYHWSMPISTHNMYLLYMDDYGIIGLFLYPLLIWCMIRGAVGEMRKLAWAMAIFLLFWGLFDHNIVQNYYSLFAISLTAAMSMISSDESRTWAVAAPVEAGLG